MPNDYLHETIWSDRYGQVCPPEQGVIVPIRGAERLDCYNPVLCHDEGRQLLAFRMEARASDAYHPESYRPSIAFASEHSDGRWELLRDPAPFDMLEDPMYIQATIDGKPQILFGGVRLHFKGNRYTIHTELFHGTSLSALKRTPYATIPDMKDVRLLQLPDGRFLLCRRPQGDAFGDGRITLHLVDSFDDLANLRHLHLPTLGVLDSGFATDWVGTNSLYLLKDQAGTQWVGLLAHLALRDKDDGHHYAATTYTLKLEDLYNNSLPKLLPHIIATRACFAEGPAKTYGLSDVVFPGNLEPLGGERYRLWAGLSDAAIGTITVDDPFHIRQGIAYKRTLYQGPKR